MLAKFPMNLKDILLNLIYLATTLSNLGPEE